MNSDRRAEYTARDGSMFIPMNVEGQAFEENFMTTPKVFTIVGVLAFLALVIAYLHQSGAGFLGCVIILGIWAWISTLLLRYVVFEEKFYYKMYKELKGNEVTTPAMFWNIASIKDTDEGAIVTYNDAKIGVVVRVYRDTITGKNAEFREVHYDAISEFYKALWLNDLNFVQMNIMETAGKDSRLAELQKLMNKSDNPALNKLMELEVGHINNKTKVTLYESDYFLIYTKNVAKVDTIITSTIECLFELMDGAYSGYEILSQRDINDFVKEEYGVNYFDSTRASLYMFNRLYGMGQPPFKIYGIEWDDGNTQELSAVELQKVKTEINKVRSGKKKLLDMKLKDIVYRKEDKKKLGVSLSAINKKQVEEEKKRKKLEENLAKKKAKNKKPEDANNQVKQIHEFDEDAETDGYIWLYRFWRRRE